MEVECFWTSTLASVPQSLKQGHSIKRLADVQRVSDGSGLGAVALALKQMQSLGCPCWYDMMMRMNTNRSEDTNTDTWFVFAQTSDRGPNEVWARSVHSQLYHEIGPKVLYLDLDCAEHCVHLCVMSGLVAFDHSIQDNVESPFKYFASCAVLANVLRDSCREIFNEWKNLYGVDSALATVRTLFPKAVGGRWGSIHAFEERCLKCGPKLHDVLMNVLQSKLNKKNKKNTECEGAGGADDTSQPMVLDTLSLEANKDYSLKMGRWRKRALDMTSSYLFWSSMHVMHDARAPLIHFSAFLKQKLPKDSQGKVSQMVNGKCQVILDELWANLMRSWNDVDVFDKLSEDDFFWLQGLSFEITCKYASQFDRRVQRKTEIYPLRLFGLIRSNPNVACSHRKIIAQELSELINGSDHSNLVLDLDPTTQKIVNDPVFCQQIIQASENGKIGHELHTFLSLLSMYIKVDVRENERVNKLLSMLGESCPNSNLDLLSSRACIKFVLGDGSRTKWSDMRGHAHEIFNACVSSWDDKEHILQNAERWSDPILPETAHDLICDANRKLKTKNQLKSSDVWAASMNQQFFKSCDSLEQLLVSEEIEFGSIAFHIGKQGPTSGDLVFFVIEKVHSNRRLQVCTYQSGRGSTSGNPEIVFSGWQFESSLTVIKQHFQDEKMTKIFPVLIGEFSIQATGSSGIAVSQVVEIEQCVIQDYIFPLYCTKKAKKKGDRVARRSRKTTGFSDLESQSGSDSDDSDSDGSEDHADHDHACSSDFVSETDTDNSGSEPTEDDDKHRAEALFQAGVADLAEEAEKRGGVETSAAGDVSEMLAGAEIARSMRCVDVDPNQDSQDADGLDIMSSDGPGPGMRCTIMQNDVDRSEDKAVKNAVKKGLNLNHPCFSETMKQFEDAGLSPEEAAVETALNSSRVMGNIDIESPSASHHIEPTTSSNVTGVTAVRDSLNPYLTDMDIQRLGRQADDPLISNALRSYSCWITGVQDGIFSLLHAQDAHDDLQQNRATFQWKELSLVLHTYQPTGSTFDQDESGLRVLLVQWVYGGKTGRVADLDSESKVIAIVPSGRKRTPLDFTQAELIHPSIGITMERVKKRDRPALPKHVKRLMNMWNVAVQAACLPEQKGLELIGETEMLQSAASDFSAKKTETETIVDASGAAQAMNMSVFNCSFCGSNEQPSARPYTTDAGPSTSASSASLVDSLQQCSLCLLFWHGSCNADMLKLVSKDHSNIDSNAGDSAGNGLGTVSASASASMAGHAEAAETSKDGHQTTYSIVESLPASASNVSKHRLKEHKDVHRLKLPSRFIPSGFDFDRRQGRVGDVHGSWSFFSESLCHGVVGPHCIVTVTIQKA